MSEALDALMLARLQFALNISFHILFPGITLALSWMLFFFKRRHAATGQQHWQDAYRFWVKVFALSFALGVVSGVTMSFQFGTNWPGFMNTVGNVAGPLLAYEVLTAFFLEAGFLGIMLFGAQRVSERVHTLATFLVAFGTSLSAFWILALNSWMQTPTGFTLVDGRVHALDWWAVIFNPSFPYRFTHMMLASFLTVAFLLAGVSAYRFLRRDRSADVMPTLRLGVLLAAVLVPAQIVVGDLHGLNTLEHQPAKIAAMEGLWRSGPSAPAVLFGWPDVEERRNRWELAIPGLASVYLKHDAAAEVQGLDAFAGEHPPVLPVFIAFRVMVGVGLLMLLVSWTAAWKLRRGVPPRWLARVLVGMSFSGWVAMLAGWYVTEIGRQPWLVYGVLRTADAASEVAAGNIGLTLFLYLALYAFLLPAFIAVLFYLARLAGERPAEAAAVEAETPQPLLPERGGRDG